MLRLLALALATGVLLAACEPLPPPPLGQFTTGIEHSEHDHEPKKGN